MYISSCKNSCSNETLQINVPVGMFFVSSRPFNFRESREINWDILSAQRTPVTENDQQYIPTRSRLD